MVRTTLGVRDLTPPFPDPRVSSGAASLRDTSQTRMENQSLRMEDAALSRRPPPTPGSEADLCRLHLIHFQGGKARGYCIADCRTKKESGGGAVTSGCNQEAGPGGGLRQMSGLHTAVIPFTQVFTSNERSGAAPNETGRADPQGLGPQARTSVRIKGAAMEHGKIAAFVEEHPRGLLRSAEKKEGVT